MRLLKVLYIAERESLRDAGRSLAGGRVVAMRRGPVLEDIYSLIRNEHSQTPIWSKFFRATGYYHLEMVEDPGMKRLSRFALKKLDEVATRLEKLDEFDLVDFTHTFDEWQKNDPGDSSRLIPLRDILVAVGRESELDKIVEHDCFLATTESDDEPA